MAMLKCIAFFPWRRCTRQLESIDRRHSNLTAFPDEIFRHERTLEELQLDANQLRDIPKNLFRLTKLKKLTLSDNEIETLPAEVGNLVNLEELDISKNDFANIPDNIKQCGKLIRIDISNNPLSRLPDTLTEVTSITCLCLNDVSLIRIPPDIGSLVNITTLEMRDNLVKFLPESFSFLSKLERLDLGSNELEELPDTIGQLSNLIDLWLDGNLLSTVPKEIGNLKNLQCLDLSENKLDELPEEISGLTSLTDLMLSQNTLHELPDGIGKLKKLSILKADQNDLDDLTPAIGGLINLTELILTDNALDSLPGAVGKLHKMGHLNVDRNNLFSLPPEIGNCARLTVLSARENQISRVPKQIGNCRSLIVLDLSANRLENLPLSISTLPLKALWLSQNQSQSILKLQVEDEEATSEKVLTCFLLPQEPGKVKSLEKFLGEVYDNPSDKHWQSLGQSVQFVDAEEPKESNLQRQLTPYPKDLKARHPKLMLHKQRSSSVDTESDREERRESVSSETKDTSFNREGKTSVRIRENVVTIGESNILNEDDPVQSVHMSDNDEERHVEFSSDVEDPETTIESRLQRKDTPHYLKGKRLGQSDESTFKEIMEKVGARSAENGDTIEEVGSTFENEGATDDDTPGVVRIKDSPATEIAEDDTENADEDDTEYFDEDTEAKTKLRRKDTPRPKELGKKERVIGFADSTRFQEEILAEEEETSVADTTEDLTEDVLVEQKTITKVYEEITTVLRRDGLSLGINIAGGKGTTPFKDDEEGVFISKIQEGGPAARDEVLAVGDKIIKVNDLDTTEVSHHDAVQALKNAGENVTLVVLREIVDEEAIARALQAQREEKNVRFAPEPEMEEIEIASETMPVVLKRDHRGLGFSIAGGRGSTPYKGNDQGIFISKLAENGPAAMDGRLQVGDKVLSINNKDMRNCRHEDAVNVLTSSGERVNMVVYRERIVNKKMTPISKLNGNANDVLIGKYPPEETATKAEITKAETIPSYEREVLFDEYSSRKSLTEEVILKKGIGPLGLSIVGGSDHTSHPFGIEEPGIFISKIVPNGVASKTNLKVGDRVLAVNDVNMKNATHHEAVGALISNVPQIKLLVRHDPPPRGMQEIEIIKAPGEKLGISIRGGAKGHPGNPFDKTDEGIFVSKVNSVGAANRDGRLKVGARILEVNSHSLLGATHIEAVRALRNTGDRLHVIVCDGYDAEEAAIQFPQSSVIANPLASVDASRKLSTESLSSIDRENAPDEVCLKQNNFKQEDLNEIEALRNARLQDTQRLEEELDRKEKELLEKSERLARLTAGGRVPLSPEQRRRLEEAEQKLRERLHRHQMSKDSSVDVIVSDSHDSETDEPDGGKKKSAEVKRQPSAAELRAIEAEKRAAWRQARMKALEEDALKAQVVLAQVKALSSSSLEGSVISDNEERSKLFDSSTVS